MIKSIRYFNRTYSSGYMLYICIYKETKYENRTNTELIVEKSLDYTPFTLTQMARDIVAIQLRVEELQTNVDLLIDARDNNK
jgi:hypothetical protein